MILVADSGSTKTDWVLIDGNNHIANAYTTIGFNPNYIPLKDIIAGITANTNLASLGTAIEKIYFYGSGCLTTALNDIIRQALMQHFTNADIEVKNDLYAAIYATCAHNEGIVCILGTGSNSCYYDGQQVYGEDFSLGYLLGDEGSGAYFGKKLLRAYFYNMMPTELQSAFFEAYSIDRNTLIEQLYRQPRANEYIASFLPFIKEHITHPYFKNLIEDGFKQFIEIFICRFEKSGKIPIHFVGSVGVHFKEILTQCCVDANIEIGKIIQSPIHELTAYHISKQKK